MAAGEWDEDVKTNSGSPNPLHDIELDRRQTPLGEIVLRQGTVQSMDDAPVTEILLDGEMLMSSVVNVSEIALAQIGLDAWGHAPCRVLVGGLGLGYTAHAALQEPSVRAVDVIELLDPVLEWHAKGQVPLGAALRDDPRVRLLQGDFFAWARGEAPAGSLAASRYDVILLDIDHSSEFLLHPAHASLYSEVGLRQIASRLGDRGVFAYWSSECDERHLADTLRRVFPVVEEHTVEFYNPRRVDYERNTIVVASTADRPS